MDPMLSPSQPLASQYEEYMRSQAAALSAWRDACHRCSAEHGFWDDPKPNLAEKVALIHSEASELLEAFRKDPTADCGKQISGKPIGLTLEEEEMADIMIRVFDLAAHRKIDIGRAVRLKYEYNLTRPHKHGKKF
jgi:NTP pyrophosphatase (non-canonical NTP hydrolase)